MYTVRHIGISQAMRLSSVWPTDFQYHIQAPAGAVHVEMTADCTVGKNFKHLNNQKVVF